MGTVNGGIYWFRVGLGDCGGSKLQRFGAGTIYWFGIWGQGPVYGIIGLVVVLELETQPEVNWEWDMGWCRICGWS